MVKRGLHRIEGLSGEQEKGLIHSSLAFEGLEDEVLQDVREVYASGLRRVFLFFLGVVAFYFVLTFFIKEVKFRADAPELTEKSGSSDVESGKAASVNSDKTDLGSASEKSDPDSPSLEARVPNLVYGDREPLSGSSTLAPNTPKMSSETFKEELDDTASIKKKSFED